jgi:hypothetical protein
VVILWTVAAAAGAGAFIMRDSGLGLAALIVVLAVSMGFAARTLVERKGSRRSGRTECLPEPVAVALLPVLVYPSRQDTRGTVHPIRQHGAIEAPPPVAMAGTSRARDARHPFRAGTGVADQ